MVPDRYNSERKRAIEKQQFEAAKNRLQRSGAIEIMSGVAHVVSGLELNIKNDFKTNKGLPPSVALRGATVSIEENKKNLRGEEVTEESQSRVSVSIQAVAHRHDALLVIDCSETGIKTQTDQQKRVVGKYGYTISRWKESPIILDENLIKKIKRGVELAGFKPSPEKQEEFDAIFKPK